MSLGWTLLGIFLCTETCVTILLIFPVISLNKWNRFLKLEFIDKAIFSREGDFFFTCFMGILGFFVSHATRQIRIYFRSETSSLEHLNIEMHSTPYIRAECNYNISGFAIFLVLIIRRMFILISSEATLLAQIEASKQQAESSTYCIHVIRVLDHKPKGMILDLADIADKRKRVEQLTSDLNDENEDIENLKKEYDRLTEECSILQNKITIGGGGEGGMI